MFCWVSHHSNNIHRQPSAPAYFITHLGNSGCSTCGGRPTSDDRVSRSLRPGSTWVWAVELDMAAAGHVTTSYQSLTHVRVHCHVGCFIPFIQT
jgi:hypothetical protein